MCVHDKHSAGEYGLKSHSIFMIESIWVECLSQQCLSLLITAPVLWPQWCDALREVIKHCSATGIMLTANTSQFVIIIDYSISVNMDEQEEETPMDVNQYRSPVVTKPVAVSKAGVTIIPPSSVVLSISSPPTARVC